MNLLELCITLKPPPAEASPETLASYTLRCEALGLQGAQGLLANPIAEREREELRWYLEEYYLWPYEQFAERAKRIEVQLVTIGKRLYDAVFESAQAQAVLQPWHLYQSSPGVNFQRWISIESSSVEQIVPAALNLPWELLHDVQGFLTLRTRQPVSIIRRLPQTKLAALPTPFTPPLRILLVTARPQDTGFIDPRGIARELLDELQPQIEQGTVTVEFLRPPTLEQLLQRLGDTQQPQVHVLHFDGHGVFAGEIDPHNTLYLSAGERGTLAFEAADGTLDLVPAKRLAQILQDSGIKLALLNACQSAMSAQDDAVSSVAAQLDPGRPGCGGGHEYQSAGSRRGTVCGSLLSPSGRWCGRAHGA